MAKRLSEQEISDLANCDSSDESGDDFSSTDEDELYVQPDTRAESSFSEREHAESRSNAQATQQAITLRSNTIQFSSLLDSSGAPDTSNSELLPSSEENVPLVGENESNEWIDIPWEIADFQFLGPEPGAKIATNKSTAPSMSADLFFNDEFLKNLVSESNRYVAKVLSTRRLRRSSRLKEWRETNKAEMKVFIAIVLHMGILQLPQKPLYWSTSEGQEGGPTIKIITDLLDEYLNKGYKVYTDNYYNSVELTRKMSANETYLCGTLQSTRKGNPKVVTSAKLKKGKMIWRRKGEVAVCKWKDKRDVLTISNMHNPEMITIRNRRNLLKLKPNIVVDYNNGMGGVDHSDQMISI
ncbi:unnamed protein product [Parnassius apollo]|uniref:(apollo) hypothetical protein n=1 Tax=Parnassius apollo TaxID=110799 RepID=A0A8S3YD03_PARAO|nr:unnamed protein product [Parnassius apollo]